MPFNRRQMLQLMTSLAVTTACPAMAWEPESPVELELLHAMPGQDAYFRQVAEAFTAKNPKIRIRFRASPANYPKLIKAFFVQPSPISCPTFITLPGSTSKRPSAS